MAERGRQRTAPCSGWRRVVNPRLPSNEVYGKTVWSPGSVHLRSAAPPVQERCASGTRSPLTLACHRWRSEDCAEKIAQERGGECMEPKMACRGRSQARSKIIAWEAHPASSGLRSPVRCAPRSSYDRWRSALSSPDRCRPGATHWQRCASARPAHHRR